MRKMMGLCLLGSMAVCCKKQMSWGGGGGDFMHENIMLRYQMVMVLALLWPEDDCCKMHLFIAQSLSPHAYTYETAMVLAAKGNGPLNSWYECNFPLDSCCKGQRCCAFLQKQ